MFADTTGETGFIQAGSIQTAGNGQTQNIKKVAGW